MRCGQNGVSKRLLMVLATLALYRVRGGSLVVTVVLAMTPRSLGHNGEHAQRDRLSGTIRDHVHAPQVPGRSSADSLALLTNRSLSTSLAELDAVSPKQASRTSQQRLSQAEKDDSELCQLDKLYVVSAPGLHATDLARFPSTADSPDGIRSATREAQGQGGTVQVLSYVSDRLAVAPVGKIARRFQRCPGKSEAVQFVRFEGLLHVGGEDASNEDEWRRMALEQLGELNRRLLGTEV